MLSFFWPGCFGLVCLSRLYHTLWGFISLFRNPAQGKILVTKTQKSHQPTKFNWHLPTKPGYPILISQGYSEVIMKKLFWEGKYPSAIKSSAAVRTPVDRHWCSVHLTKKPVILLKKVRNSVIGRTQTKMNSGEQLFQNGAFYIRLSLDKNWKQTLDEEL